jgi:hypothetical protein
MRVIRHGHFEDVLCQIHRHRRSIHVGLLLVWLRATVHGNDAAKEPGGVHTIIGAGAPAVRCHHVTEAARLNWKR